MSNAFKRSALGGIALSCLAVPVAAHAEETSVSAGEAIVVTASRAEQKIKNIPANIELISAGAIEETPSYVITDILKKNASLDVIEYPGGQSGIGIRGFRPEFSGVNQRILTLVNGRPSGATSVGNVASAGLERIEVVKGSASAIYGPSAMGGVVNFITRESRGKIGGNITAGYGSFDTLHLQANLGGALSDVADFDLGVRHYSQLEDFKMGSGGRTYGSFVQGQGKRRENTAFEQNSFYARLGLNLSQDWRVQGRLMRLDGPGIETPGAETDGRNNQGVKNESYLGGDIALTGSAGAHDLTALYYRVTETGDVFKKPVNSDPYLTSDRSTKFQGVQLQDNWSIADEVDLIIGGDWGHIRNTSGSYNPNGTRKGAFTPNFERENIGMFADVTARLWDERLIVNLGGRYDWITAKVLETPLRLDLTPGSSDFKTFNPRAGIVLRPLENVPIRLHASAGTGFVVPEANEIAGLSEDVVGLQTRVTKGNPNLKPEKSESFDIGVGYDGKAFGVDVTYFMLTVKDRIASVIKTNTATYRETSYENANSSKSSGLEATVQMDPLAVLTGNSTPVRFDASLTHFFKRSEELSTGESVLRNTSKTKLNVGLGYNDGTVRARLSGRYTTGVYDSDFSTGRLFTKGVGGYYEYDPFTVYDLTLGWRIDKTHDISLKVDNLTNKYYYEKGDYPLAGRKVMATYSYNF